MAHTADSMASSKKPIHLFLLLETILAAIGYAVAFKISNENRTGSNTTPLENFAQQPIAKPARTAQ